MASEVVIGNLALAHLGDDATIASIDPPEGSPQAQMVAQFYPIARDSLLETHAWSFATFTEALAPHGHVVDGYANVYALPARCLRPLLIYPPGGRDTAAAAEFEVEIGPNDEPLLLTNVPNAILRGVRRITDSARFTPIFVETLSWMLASMVAGPLIKGESGVNAAKNCWQVFLLRLTDAIRIDANKNVLRIEAQAPWIEAR